MKLFICLLCIASVLVLTPVVMAAGPVEFLDGLVLYHPYDEGEGSNLIVGAR